MRFKLSRFVAGAVVAISIFGTAGMAQASSLTLQQISAIVNLLQSFGADATTIANVQASLGGSSTVLSCNTFANSTYGNFDTDPGGRVSQLQTWLGISSNTFGFGTYGPKTRTLWNSRCGLTMTTQTTPSTTNTTLQLENKIPTGWVSYQNRDIGIAFSYPKNWGKIKTGKEGGCTPNIDYYGASVVQQMINEVSASNDPCSEVRLSANNKAFLSTMSKLYTKYPIPRGGDWGNYAADIQASASVETYCTNKSKENCSVYKNSNGVLVARDLVSLDEGADSGWIYVIKSAHPFYNGTILYAGGSSEYKKVIEQVVDGLRFLQ